MSPTRVMIFSSSFLPKAGGLQYELKWYLDSLDEWCASRQDYEFSFVSPGQTSLKFAKFKNIQSFDLDFDEFSPRGTATSLRTLFRLSRVLRKIQPDVVHCHAVLPDAGLIWLASLGMRTRPKIVTTSHGQDIVVFPEYDYGSRRSSRMNRVIKFFANRLSAHVLPSAALGRFADDLGVDSSKRVVIPNGLPIGSEPDFEYKEDSKSSASDHTNEDLSGIRFMSLSSGRPIKNLDILVEAFAEVRGSLGDSRLLLACVGPSAVHIHELVDRLNVRDHVDFIGEVSGTEKREYFRSADVYCQTSQFENSPVSLLESMKFGSAIIASNVGGVPEMIQDGHNGILVDQNDVQDVAAALLLMYQDSDLRKLLISNGVDYVKNHSMFRTIEKYSEVYKSVTAGGN